MKKYLPNLIVLAVSIAAIFLVVNFSTAHPVGARVQQVHATLQCEKSPYTMCSGGSCPVGKTCVSTGSTTGTGTGSCACRTNPVPPPAKEEKK